MKRIVKALFATLFCLFAGNAFAREWYLCLGSFKNVENANARSQILNDNRIPTFVYEYKNESSETYYRVVLDEPCATEMEAVNARKNIYKMIAIEKLEIKGIWYFQLDRQGEQETALPIVPDLSSVDEKRIITIKDSDTGLPIPEAQVTIDNTWKTRTDSNGNAPIPNEVPDGEHELLIEKENEYVPTKTSMLLSQGKISTAPQISVPKAVDYNRIKIVLDWGEYPSDLDSHITHEGHHVYYSNQDSGNMNLDRDDTSSYGPETITIREMNGSPYHYFVFNYSNQSSYGDSLSYSGARVRVFFNNEQQAEFNITPGKVGCTWHVFDIENGNQIKVFDEVNGEYPYIYDEEY